MNQEKMAREFESRFPPIETAIKFIDDLSNLDLAKIDLSDLTELIDSIFYIIPMTSGFVEKGTILYRARVNKKNQQFGNISELGMPPEKFISKYGRANAPRERIFYSANTSKLACGEVLQNLKYSFNPKNEIGVVTVSLWEVKKRLHFSTLYYSPKVTKFREDIAKFKKGNQDFTKQKGIIKESVIKTQDLILEFFCEEFAKDTIKTPDDYKISTFYTKRVKQANEYVAPQFADNKFDGIVYPSVAMKYKGDNIVLFDSNLDEKIKFKTAFEMICVDFDFQKADFKSYFFHEIKEVKENGDIVWDKDVYQPKKENNH